MRGITTCFNFTMTGIALFVLWYQWNIFVIGVINLAGQTSSPSGIITGGLNAWHLYFPCRMYALPIHLTIKYPCVSLSLSLKSYHDIFHSWCQVRFTYILSTNVCQLQTSFTPLYFVHIAPNISNWLSRIPTQSSLVIQNSCSS